MMKISNELNSKELGAGDVAGEMDIEKDTEGARSPSIISKEEENGVATPQDADSNIVWWDGPDDPQNPMNWSSAHRWGAVAIVGGITFLTPLASSMFAPGIGQIMKEFGNDSTLLAGFVVSVYVLGFALGPLIIAPMSEMYGRLPIYHCCNVLFIIFNVACGASSNLAMLIVFRFFAGCFGVAPVTLGGGTIADVIPKEHRALAMAAWLLGPTAGPAIGPVAGGFVSQAKGWRWNFWIISIIAGTFTLFCFVVMRETYAPTMLNRKAARLRKETGNPNLRSKLDKGRTPKDLFWFSITRPSKLILFSPICLTISLYVAIIYAYLYIMFTTFTPVFEQVYGFGQGVVGLSYIGLGVGCIVGQFYTTFYGNAQYMKHVKAGDVKPEHRLPQMIQGGIILPVGFFWYGWSVEARIHWMMPLVGTAIIGFALLLIWMPATTYLIDAFGIYSASAVAASVVLRSFFGAFVPLAGQDMYEALGYGWGNSLLAFVAIAFIPAPILFVRYGEWLRTKFEVEL